MRLARLRFTVRRLMVAVAIVAIELGCGSFIHRHLFCGDISAIACWVDTCIQLVFANLLIGVPACIFVGWVHNLWRVDQEPKEDR
jgi:hypothetical protein